MRVTNKMISDNFLNDMSTNLQNMQKLQQQMTSGKEISKPSDDPFKVARVMQLNTDINTNTQYNSNITDTSNWLDTTDTALGNIGDTLKRINELMISSGNGGYSQSERSAIKDEINQRVSEIAQYLNTNFDGKYIFGGTRGTDKPTDTVQYLNLSEATGSTATGTVSGKYSGATAVNLQVKISQVVTSPATPTGQVTGVQVSTDAGATWSAQIVPSTVSSVDPPEFDLGSGLRIHFNTSPTNAINDTLSFNTGDMTKSGNTKLVFYNNNPSNSNPELITDGSTTSIRELDKINKGLNVEVSQGVTLTYNTTAGDILQFKNESGVSVDLRSLLNNIVNHLDGKNADGTTPSTTDPNPVTELTGTDLTGISEVLTNILKERAQVGAKQNRMTSAKDKNDSENSNLTDILSKTEDIDITQKTIEYSTAQTVYLAALQTSAKVIQHTLLDYL